MGENFALTLAASLLAGGVTTAGILAIRRYEGWARQNSTYFVCFAAGVLIAVSFLHIVPTSFAMAPEAPACLFAGYMLTHLLNRFLTTYVCDRPETARLAIGLVPLFGIGFHSFLDGVVYSISFSVSLLTGGLVALGMVLHEFPEGIVTYAMLVRGGVSGRRAFWLAFLASAATTPLGTLVSYPWISRIDQDLLGALLALSAGALIYVGATHLLPQAEREPRRFSLLALAAGGLVALGIVLSKG
ncbi:ZIP family metal transporter [Nisaea nitritireducens]|uniref:ZIP family metal transporter n=1 Tax=Nisaea nitritireducens TaxID=568392 RepID=UPI0018695D1D|nr:ZIP family metal transporter [Nisaea nitritireducens]